MLERKNQYIFQDDNFWSGAAIGSQLVIEISEEFCQKSSSFLKEKKTFKKCLLLHKFNWINFIYLLFPYMQLPLNGIACRR